MDMDKERNRDMVYAIEGNGKGALIHSFLSLFWRCAHLDAVLSLEDWGVLG